MTAIRPRSLDDLDALLSVDHPVIAFDIGAGFSPPAYALGTLVDGGAVAVQRRSDRGHPGLAVLGSPPAVRSLLVSEEVRALVREQGLTHISVPRSAFGQVVDLHEWGGGGEWDWMWTTTAVPPLPHEPVIEVVDETAAGELVEFLQRANPRTHGEPFARPHQLWVTLRQDGRLVACGSWDLATSGIPVLAGIAVDPTRRGEGFGAAVTAYLTRRAVSGFGACTLGMFADNVTARRLYHRLGYRTGAEWSSRWFAREPAASSGPDLGRPSGRPPGHRTAAAP
jgi:GNAT superfamily N-acetyltransferase